LSLAGCGLASAGNLVAAAKSFHERGTIFPIGVGGAIGTFFVGMGTVFLGVLHAMHRAIADVVRTASFGVVGACARWGSFFVGCGTDWSDRCNGCSVGATGRFGSWCANGHVGTMVSSFACCDATQFVDVGDFLDEGDQDVSCIGQQSPRLAFCWEMPITFKRLEDCSNNSHISWWRRCMLVGKCHNTVNFGPILFNGAVGDETVVELVELTVDVGHAHCGVCGLEMRDDFLDRATTNGTIFCCCKDGKVGWWVGGNQLAAHVSLDADGSFVGGALHVIERKLDSWCHVLIVGQCGCYGCWRRWDRWLGEHMSVVNASECGIGGVA
jgi:hypothetical protein